MFELGGPESVPNPNHTCCRGSGTGIKGLPIAAVAEKATPPNAPVVVVSLAG